MTNKRKMVRPNAPKREVSKHNEVCPNAGGEAACLNPNCVSLQHKSTDVAVILVRRGPSPGTEAYVYPTPKLVMEYGKPTAAVRQPWRVAVDGVSCSDGAASAAASSAIWEMTECTPVVRRWADDQNFPARDTLLILQCTVVAVTHPVTRETDHNISITSVQRYGDMLSSVLSTAHDDIN